MLCYKDESKIGTKKLYSSSVSPLSELILLAAELILYNLSICKFRYYLKGNYATEKTL